MNFLPLTVENIEKQNKLVLESNYYGKEAKIIHDCLNEFPENKDLNIIAMKIALALDQHLKRGDAISRYVSQTQYNKNK